MKRITIEVDEETHEKLKKNSKLNNRSLRGELKTIIQSSFEQPRTNKGHFF